MANVFAHGRPDPLILIGVNQRPNSFVGKNFSQQTFVDLAVNNVNSRDSGLTCPQGILRFGKQAGRELIFGSFKQILQFRYSDLGNEPALHFQAVVGGDQHQFDCAECPRDLDGDRVGVEPVGVAIAVKAERGDDWNDALIE